MISLPRYGTLHEARDDIPTEKPAYLLSFTTGAIGAALGIDRVQRLGLVVTG